jgi:hypothetical protein
MAKQPTFIAMWQQGRVAISAIPEIASNADHGVVGVHSVRFP